MTFPTPLAVDPLEHVLPHDLIRLGPIAITNQMLMALVAALLMLLIFPRLFRRADPTAPTGSKNFFEAILEFLRVEVFRPALKEHTDRFVPFLWTLFFFILFANLLGQLPIAEFLIFVKGLFTHGHYVSEHSPLTHLGGTATGTLTTTGALAICAFVFIHLNGIGQVARSLVDGTYGHHDHHEEHSADGSRGHEAAQDLEHVRGEALAADVPANFKAVGDPTGHYADDEFVTHHHARPDHGDLHGGGGAARAHRMNPGEAVLKAIPLYIWNFAPHPFKPGPGQSALMWVPDLLMWGMLLILELIGAVIKPFALMIRLFANMIAGHIVLAALILLIPVTASLALQIGVGVPVTALSLLIRLLEVFVAFLQAYIFVFLTTLFIASAVAPEH
jgi:F0F1-type ATP synthase membrane subunit a